MRERLLRRSPFAIDVGIFTIRNAQLEVLLWKTSDAREKWILPWDQPRPQEQLETGAQRIVREAIGTPAPWIELAGAFGEGNRHPADAEISVAFAAVLPGDALQLKDPQLVWHRVSDLPPMTQKRKIVVEAALSAVRFRLEHSPIAFRLLPPLFTLSELQKVYEVLLGKRLHKASFRRALHAAEIVEATEEWRGEGRGRPAQLFRYAPPKKRRTPRGIRFDALIA
jgi:8-oxo-dGTP diphosphatase